MLHKPVSPMLLEKSETVPTGDFIWQLKYDGFRAITSYIKNDGVMIYSRHKTNCTNQFPEMQLEFPVDNVVLDGEMIVLQNGRPSFESVMTRFQASNEMKIKGMTRTLPAHFVAFDILYLNGKGLTNRPIEERLDILSQVVNPSDSISVCPSFDDGEALFESVKRLGLEGVVSKRRGSKYYVDTRSSNWLKTKDWKYSQVRIAGIRKDNFGWLLMDESDRIVGVCELVPYKERMAFSRVAKSITNKVDKKWIYLEPRITCKVKYHALSNNGMMRTPSFVEFVL